jgi:hypothetical protein
MYLPYTDNFPEAVAVAAQSVAATLTAAIWSRPLRKRSATILFGIAIWMAALTPLAPSIAGLLHLEPGPRYFSLLQISATLAIIATLLDGSRLLGVLAAVGQCALYALAHYVRDSDAEIAFAYIFFYGVLIGVHALRGAPPNRVGSASAERSFARQDGAIFLATTCLAFLVTNLVFGRLVFNGDEVANSFQADVYGHLRAFAPIPPCPSMFWNYWVFHHHGHAFSQYTPGWPLFMAPFQRLGIIWLAGPIMGGLLAVALARLSRRLASGLGTTPEESEGIVAIAGWLGPIFAMLGPYLLLNAASRFSHTMVCACFAWAVESLCVVGSKTSEPWEGSEPPATGSRDWGYGFLLGAATSLGLATRPADGATLGVGVFLYFLWALAHRRITWRAFLGTSAGFLLFGGLTAIILRLQLGAWFQTGYTISPAIHPEAALRLSWPEPNQWKNGVPLATGSYGWWPAAPALGIAGLLRALGGRERRVAFMLATSALLLLGFYFFVEFTRGSYEGLGPRYVTPLVVPMATGGACLLAPLFERARALGSGFRSGIGRAGPALLALLALAYGVIRLGPHEYPVAYAENRYATAPGRAARQAGLKNAIVLIEPGHVPADEWNLAQNPPMNPNPDVLFLIRRSPADEVCARQHFPGRKWYRAGMTDRLTPW